MISISIHPTSTLRARAAAWLRRGMLAALLAGALVPASASAQEPAVPDTPAGRRFTALRTLLQQRDTASIQAFVDAHMNAPYRAMPLAAHLQALTWGRERLANARLVALDAQGPTALRAVFEAGGVRYTMDLEVEAAAPNLISGIGMGPESDQLPAPEALTVAQVREVVDSTIVQMERNYVSADTGRLIADRLRARRDAGAYDALTRPRDLAEALTTDLRAQNGDRHLGISVRGPGAGGGRAGGGGQAQRRGNYGFSRVEVLDGNVGYIKLTGISGAPEARDVALNALRFVQNTDAVILDLRDVPGGSAQMANFLISHFTAPDQPSLRVYWREGDRTEVRNTLAEVPGPRRTDVPLYVLIDRGAASAAEDIPFVLQNLRRATLVGERTAGAGRNNGFVPVGYGMTASISISRVTDPASGREWETVGVQPDIQSTSAGALAAAHQDALRKLAQAEQDEARRTVLESTAEYVGAQVRPAAVPAERLASYAGRYAGGRMVIAEGGRLFFQPAEDEPRRELHPLADGRFAAGPLLRVEFAAGEGGRPQLRLSTPGQPPRVFDRQP
jgi:Peptidase family S41/N-terminal domain of Peptidase_S41 in eukaryotic IRBP